MPFGIGRAISKFFKSPPKNSAKFDSFGPSYKRLPDTQINEEETQPLLNEKDSVSTEPQTLINEEENLDKLPEEPSVLEKQGYDYDPDYDKLFDDNENKNNTLYLDDVDDVDDGSDIKFPTQKSEKQGIADTKQKIISLRPIVKEKIDMYKREEYELKKLENKLNKCIKKYPNQINVINNIKKTYEEIKKINNLIELVEDELLQNVNVEKIELIKKLIKEYIKDRDNLKDKFLQNVNVEKIELIKKYIKDRDKLEENIKELKSELPSECEIIELKKYIEKKKLYLEQNKESYNKAVNFYNDTNIFWRNNPFSRIKYYGGKTIRNKKRQGGTRKKSKTTKHVKTIKKRKWSNKYKKSINCKKPKGFSQKQYCKSKKRR